MESQWLINAPIFALFVERSRFEVYIGDVHFWAAVLHLCLSKAVVLQDELKDTLYEQISASAVSLTTD